MRFRWIYIGWFASFLMVISSFLPWAYIDLWVITQKISGIRLDGLYTFLVGLIGLGLLIWKPGKHADITSIFLGLIALLILGNNMLRFQNVLLRKNYFFGVDISKMISIGYGSYLTLFGGVLLMIYGIVSLRKNAR